ncbi:MAG: cytochrome b/b6 domain-containing protein [SAR324 cluster bacterium]|nr:cytochrome b/b6 domain-containing protein [SAR324 cluster bacterium]
MSPEQLKPVFLENGTYRPSILSAFDQNKDGELTLKELRLDSDEKMLFMKRQLQASGFENPEITGKLEVGKVHHGIVRGAGVARDCRFCHGEDSRLNREIKLASYLPGNVMPPMAESLTSQAELTVKTDGSLSLQRNLSGSGFYVLGTTKSRLVDRAGLLFLFLTCLVLLGHGGYRFYSRKRYPPHHTNTSTVYMYTFYERLWHWTSALSILLLMFTGFEIHYSWNFSVLGIDRAVYVHNILAFIMIANAFLSLFYHLASAEIRQYFPRMKSFVTDTMAQIRYYTSGIFKGEPHPLQKTPDRKLNPLQQITYLVILNILLPTQVLTGLLMWGVERWPELSLAIGGLTWVAPIHTLCSWLFFSFVILHVYLTTTGHTVTSNIKAMIGGFDKVDVD